MSETYNGRREQHKPEPVVETADGEIKKFKDMDAAESYAKRHGGKATQFFPGLGECID